MYKKGILAAAFFTFFLSACGGGGDDSQPEPIPDPPTISVSGQTLDLNEDQSLTFSIETSSSVEGTISAIVMSSSSNGIISGTYPELTYTPNENFEGSDSFSYQLSTGEITSQTATITFNVVGINDAPVISATPVTELVAHNTYRLLVTTADVDNDTLEFNVENIPSWASFDEQTGELSGIPTNEDVGIYEDISISVSDGEVSTQLPPFDIEITINQEQPGGVDITFVGAVQKGPFVIGSTVTINLLNPDAVNTGTTVVTNTLDDLGQFSFSLDQKSDLLEISSTGYYRNEITGELSQGTITLRSLTNMTLEGEQTAYVNILTHLTSQRIKKLIGENSLSYSDARDQAETELLQELSHVISNSEESDFSSLSIYVDQQSIGSSYLLAVSSIFYQFALNQADSNSTNPDAELTLALNSIEADFGEDGTIDDSATLDSLRAVIPNIDPTIVADNINGWLDGQAGFENIDINEYLDSDLDGDFNSIDLDDDNDGIDDEFDTFPYEKNFAVNDQNLEGVEDQNLELSVETNNPFGDEINIEILSAPRHGSISGSYPELTYVPQPDYEGNDSFEYRLIQSDIVSNSARIDISITAVNDAPTIDGTPTTEFVAHNEYSFVPRPNDVDGDSLRLSVENLPSWAVFNEETGEISGFATNDDVALYQDIVISVTDGEQTATLPSFNIDVQINPYELGFSVENQEVELDEDTEIQIDISSNNPLGTSIAVLLEQSPVNGSISGSYPELTYEPNPNFNGTDTFKYKLSQDVILSGEVTVMVTVSPVNDAPTISGIEVNSVTAFENYSFTPSANDIDTDVLEFNIQNLPAWASFDSSTGSLTGTPSNSDVGIYEQIIISVSDGIESTELESFDIEVIGNPWESLPNLPTPRHSPASVEHDGMIYALGGYRNDRLNVVEVFDTSTGSWATLQSMQQTRHSHTANIIEGKIYSIGGIASNSLSSVELFDTSTQEWSNVSSMITSRDSHSSCVHEGKLFVFGGRSNYVSLTSVEMYDPSIDTWSPKASNSKLGWGASCVTVGNEIFVFGGASNEYGYEVYDPVTDTWTRSGTLNKKMRYGFALHHIGQYIYVIGGYNGLDTVEVYDTTTNSWSQNTPIPFGLHDMGSVILNNEIYIMGGRDGSTNSMDVFYKYNPAFE